MGASVDGGAEWCGCVEFLGGLEWEDAVGEGAVCFPASLSPPLVPVLTHTHTKLSHKHNASLPLSLPPSPRRCRRRRCVAEEAAFVFHDTVEDVSVREQVEGKGAEFDLPRLTCGTHAAL